MPAASTPRRARELLSGARGCPLPKNTTITTATTHTRTRSADAYAAAIFGGGVGTAFFFLLSSGWGLEEKAGIVIWLSSRGACGCALNTVHACVCVYYVAAAGGSAHAGGDEGGLQRTVAQERPRAGTVDGRCVPRAECTGLLAPRSHQAPRDRTLDLLPHI